MDKQTKIKRIMEMEQKMNHVTEALNSLENALDTYANVQIELHDLIQYYDSPKWRSDYEADEQGEFSHALKRGVLSEDGIYNLLAKHRELTKMMQELSN